MSKLIFESAAQRANGKPITFTLDGRKFKFERPKTVAVWLTQNESLEERIRVQLNWLSAGLSDEDSDHITGRLMDFDDPLTVDTLIEVVAGLMEETSGRPTGPSSESSERR